MLAVRAAAVALLIIHREDELAVVRLGEDGVVQVHRGSGNQRIAVKFKEVVASVFGHLPAFGVEGGAGLHADGRTFGNASGIGPAPAFRKDCGGLVVFGQNEIPAFLFSRTGLCPFLGAVHLGLVYAQHHAAMANDQFLIGESPEETHLCKADVQDVFIQVLGITVVDIGKYFIDAADVGVQTPVGTEVAFRGYHIVLVEETVYGTATGVVPALFYKVRDAVVEDVAGGNIGIGVEYGIQALDIEVKILFGGVGYTFAVPARRVQVYGFFGAGGKNHHCGCKNIFCFHGCLHF